VERKEEGGEMGKREERMGERRREWEMEEKKGEEGEKGRGMRERERDERKGERGEKGMRILALR
jgi:hypothetical protein